MTAPHAHASAPPARDLPHPPEVVQAAQWLSDNPEPPRPIVPHLQERFGLGAAQVCDAIYLAGSMRLLRRAFG